jgi:alkanesulfonate monooxygenase SsuD/methylene tetrahydromethanopterin reductase-like flavin-dependent oxidoreductase (luciferase family)
MTTYESNLRFGVLDLPDAPFPALAERWRLVEELGFDFLWAPDHTAYWRKLDTPWFDGWTTLAAMAAQTSRVRIGTLVTNPILRHPVILARQAAAVDHLSGGRLELGVGTGIAGFDHAAVGSAYWAPRERAERFAEYVRVVDELLRGGGRPYSFAGRYYATSEARAVPQTPQQPRPPITVGGQSPTVLRVAAARADCWNTHGPFGMGMAQILAVTARQNALLDDLCEAERRDPGSLRRSLLLFDALDAWSSPDALERVVEAFSAVGVREYTLFWPGDDRRRELERVALEVIPRLRAGLRSAPGGRGAGLKEMAALSRAEPLGDVR